MKYPHTCAKIWGITQRIEGVCLLSHTQYLENVKLQNEKQIIGK